MVSERASIVRPVVADLQRIFGNRLEAIVVYGRRERGPVPTLALVRSCSLDDLAACAERSAAWRRAQAATPLLLTSAEFARSLDAFPIEYGEILAHHQVVFGQDPFLGLSIGREDLRRACEVQVKSHLLHLREDYIESGGKRGAVDELVRESAPSFTVLLRHLARLDDARADSTADLIAYASDRIHLSSHVVDDVIALANDDGLPAIDTAKLFPDYLAALERVAEFVDRWRAA